MFWAISKTARSLKRQTYQSFRNNWRNICDIDIYVGEKGLVALIGVIEFVSQWWIYGTAGCSQNIDHIFLPIAFLAKKMQGAIIGYFFFAEWFLTLFYPCVNSAARNICFFGIYRKFSLRWDSDWRLSFFPFPYRVYSYVFLLYKEMKSTSDLNHSCSVWSAFYYLKPLCHNGF